MRDGSGAQRTLSNSTDPHHGALGQKVASLYIYSADPHHGALGQKVASLYIFRRPTPWRSGSEGNLFIYTLRPPSLIIPPPQIKPN